MCRSRAEGGKRCAAHTHVGVAATTYAAAITDLDDGQVASIFHRLRKDHRDTPAPTPDEVVTTLTRMRREALEDTRLEERTANRIASRYDRAIAAAEAGEVPDGDTWEAMQQTPVEAEIAQNNLDRTLRYAARHQRTSGERLEAKFRKWRRDPGSFEDLESPDPAFRINPEHYPADQRTQKALRKLGFENYLAQRLPVFVYGTLRNGQGNDRLMNGAIEQRSEQAHVNGIAVYGPDRGFPYAQEAPDGQGVTKGDLVYLMDDTNGDWARNSLDNLEGFSSDRFNDSHYRRVAHEVTYVDPDTGQTKSVKAWVYLAGDWSRRSLSEAERIHDGDWVQARESFRNRRNRRPAASYASTRTEDSFTGSYVVKKAAVDPTPARSAESSASVFAAAGLLDDDPAEDAGFWSQYQ